MHSIGEIEGQVAGEPFFHGKIKAFDISYIAIGETGFPVAGPPALYSAVVIPEEILLGHIAVHIPVKRHHIEHHIAGGQEAYSRLESLSPRVLQVAGIEDAEDLSRAGHLGKCAVGEPEL